MSFIWKRFCLDLHTEQSTIEPCNHFPNEHSCEKSIKKSLTSKRHFCNSTRDISQRIEIDLIATYVLLAISWKIAYNATVMLERFQHIYKQLINLMLSACVLENLQLFFPSTVLLFRSFIYHSEKESIIKNTSFAKALPMISSHSLPIESYSYFFFTYPHAHSHST